MKLKHLNPIFFAKQTLSFMQGYPKIKIWAFIPIAYVKYIYYFLKDTIK
jgi:hypothetical protein